MRKPVFVSNIKLGTQAEYEKATEKEDVKALIPIENARVMASLVYDNDFSRGVRLAVVAPQEWVDYIGGLRPEPPREEKSEVRHGDV